MTPPKPEESRPRTTPVTIGVQPPHELSDGVVTLRLPTEGDAHHLKRWATPEMLDGVWISGTPSGPIDDPESWSASIVDELLRGWTEIGSIHGPALVIDETEPFVGIAYLTERPDASIELSYGVAPPFRRRGIATRTARTLSDWLLAAGLYQRVELRIAAAHPERMVIAERSGFRRSEEVETYIEGTGKTFIDVVFVRERATR